VTSGAERISVLILSMAAKSNGGLSLLPGAVTEGEGTGFTGGAGAGEGVDVDGDGAVFDDGGREDFSFPSIS